MVLKRLPTKLVASMRKIYNAYPFERTRKLILKRKSADHRRPDSPTHRQTFAVMGTRIRKMKLLGKKVIIKVCHVYSAKENITAVRKIVDEHNKIHTNANYILRKPKAHIIGNYYLAMSEADLPNLYEIFGDAAGRVTSRGTQALERLETITGKDRQALIQQLQKVYLSLNKNIRELRSSKKYLSNEGFFSRANVLLAGFEKGKFIFIPLPDLH